MASVSVTFSLRHFNSSPKLPSFTSQASNTVPSLRKVYVGWSCRNFPSLRTFRISCAQAQPETVQKVCDVVRKQLALPPESEVIPETKFSALGADSLDTVEIVMSLEEEFGINIEEQSSENISTVQEAAELIEKLIKKKGGE